MPRAQFRNLFQNKVNQKNIKFIVESLNAVFLEFLSARSPFLQNTLMWQIFANFSFSYRIP